MSNAPRTGGRILVDALRVHGVDLAFGIPGESYLPVLDALYDTPEIRFVSCRQEGGAAFMAEAYGKLTGRPGICFVTRGPGATNASIGLHTAFQDSTPLILFIGQVGSEVAEREGFQEMDYRRMYGQMAKWIAQIDRADRVPEYVSRAFHTAVSGRPGPVVLALPEDMQSERAAVADTGRYHRAAAHPAAADMRRLRELLAQARRPFVLLGGSGWTAQACADIRAFVEANALPVGASYRCQDGGFRGGVRPLWPNVAFETVSGDWRPVKHVSPMQRLAIVLVLFLWAASGGFSFAQSYPVKPIRLVVPYPPGGTPDMQGRLLAEKLRPRLGQNVIIDNRPGGNASVGMSFVARAAPDGYTLIIATVGPWTVNPYLYDLPYDTLADLAPVIHATSSAGVLAVHPSIPAKSVKELVALARAKPGTLDYGSAGVGGFGHMCGELFSMLTGTKMTHVPFKGVAAAMVDTVAGRVPVSFNVAAVTIPLVQTGKLRALATTGATRMETLPDLPTIAEAGVPGYENSTWVGIGAPARTPAAVIERLHNETMAVLQMADVREALRAQGAAVTGWPPERFRDYLKVELAKYGKIVKAANIKNQ